MHIRLGLAALPLALLLACSPGGDSPQPSADGGQDQPGGQSGASEDPSVARPAAEVRGDCRPRPTGDGTLVAQLDVVNTGDIGVDVRVFVRWPQAGGDAVTKSQRTKVELGETKPLTARLRMDPDEAEAVRRAVKRGRTCHVRHRVLGAFGAPG